MLEHKYVQMPQDDNAQIDQVETDYSTGAAKGLAHGVQKDAIQNAFGARSIAKEIEACKRWTMKFRLEKINGKDALIFWDEGTTGLTGKILTSEEIIQGFASRNLGPEQRLSRFLSRFVSGGNLGAGTFGRGKLVFHAASENKSILIDSLRDDDGEYVALDRKVDAGILLQPDRPYTNAEAKDFIAERTNGILKPLTCSGTRITILNIKPEVSEAFRRSFSSHSSSYKASLAYMIEETWWEIIDKFDARIFLELNDKMLQVELHDPLLEIIEAEDGQDGVRVHRKENIDLTASGQRYRIKELKFVVMPSNLDEDFRDIWVQRKRMRVGSIFRNISPHHKIMNRLAAYVICEPELEDLIENAEGVTHYDFHLGATGIKQIRQIVKQELSELERRLGLISINEDAESRRRLIDSMKEINELAPELGLVTQHGIGADKDEVDILLKKMFLPEENTLRIEINDEVGPIIYEMAGRTQTTLFGMFCVVAKQKDRDIIRLYSEEITLGVEEKRTIEIPAFSITKDIYENGKSLQIEAFWRKQDSTEVLARCIRTLFIGTDPSVTHKSPVALSFSSKFPRSDTRRVEMADVITKLKVKVTNATPYTLFLDLICSVRHLANPKTGRLTAPLGILYRNDDFMLEPQQDFEYYLDDLAIKPEIFGSVHQTLADVTERACDIFSLVRLSRSNVDLNKPKKYKLSKVSVPFYLEVDPPGFSIFNNAETAIEPADGRQSWYTGSIDAGYTFVLNAGHGAYKFISKTSETFIIKSYEQEQMLRKAYLIAFENDFYRGPAEQYKETLCDPNSSALDIARTFDTIIGHALNQMRG